MHLIEGDKLVPSANGISPSAIPFVLSFHPSILLIRAGPNLLGLGFQAAIPLCQLFSISVAFRLLC